MRLNQRKRKRKEKTKERGEVSSAQGDDFLSAVSSSVVHAFYASVALHALSLSHYLFLSLRTKN